MTGTFVASDDPGENPMFSSWNKVFVPYCRYVPTCKGINPLTIGFITTNNSGLTPVIVDSFENVVIMIHGQGFMDDISLKI